MSRNLSDLNQADQNPSDLFRMTPLPRTCWFTFRDIREPVAGTPNLGKTRNKRANSESCLF
jgi:hypothetical protein